MAELTPQQQNAVARLKKWALSPEGQARVGLKGPHPFTACTNFYRGKLPARMIDGWCAELVHASTGHWPGRKRGDKDKG